MTAYDIVDDAAIIAAALVAGEASVLMRTRSLPTVVAVEPDLMSEADALLGGNGTARLQQSGIGRGRRDCDGGHQCGSGL